METSTTSRRPRAHLFHRRQASRPGVVVPDLWAPDRPGQLPERPRQRRAGDLHAGPEAAGSARGGGPRPPVLLADLTSPWAYLAHLRLQDAQEREVDAPVWWAVCDAPTVPLTGSREEGPARERRRAELEAVRAAADVGEEIPDVPSVLPHPRPVAAAFAEGVDLGRGAEVLRLLLEAYWWDGRDIGDPEVLRRLLPSVLVDGATLCTGDPRREWGYVVTPAREPLSDHAYHLLGRWQRQWVELGRPGPLTLVDDKGARVRAGALTALSVPAGRTRD